MLGCKLSASAGGVFNDPVPVQVLVGGGGVGCRAKATFIGRTSRETWYSYHGSSYTSFSSLLPGSYILEVTNFDSSCKLGTAANWITLTIMSGGKVLTSAGFMSPTGSFYLPAIPRNE